MKTITLVRHTTSDFGTFGTIELPGRKLVTGELPDRGNARGLSSIPPGTYRLKVVSSPHFRRLLYGVMDVPDRDHILLHGANLMGDSTKGLRCELDGCIAPGLAQATFDGQLGIANSGDALQALEQYLGGDEASLVIVNEYVEAGKIEGATA
jgi:hypothetical protein